MFIAIGLLATLLVLNGILAMSELAMMTSRRSRLQQAAGRGSKGAAKALTLADDPTRFLSTVQMGITLIGILSGAFAEKALASRFQEHFAKVPGLDAYSDDLALALVVLIVTYFSLVIGELVPKRIALAFPEMVASIISRPLAALSVVTAWPVKALTVSTELVLNVLRIRPATGDDVSEEDVQALVARAASTGVFTPQEHGLFKKTMQVGALSVRDLMVPRSEIVWIEEDMPADAVRALIGSSPYSHFPVCRGGLDNLIGVVHIKDLIGHGLLDGREFRMSEVAHQPIFAPDNMPALRLMEEFKRTKNHVAFVVDEYGVTLGLLTLRDVVAALIGDIGRRGEEPRPKAVRRDDGSWLLDGRLPLHEALAGMGVSAEQSATLPDVSTVAGLVLAQLGHVPREGEHTFWHGWRFEVVDMDATRIDQVLATKNEDRPRA